MLEPAFVLACAILPGFAQEGEARSFDTESLYEYMNGNSEGYFLYGFTSMRGITCKKGDLKVIVDVSEFKEPELAYGMFTGNLDPRQPLRKIGAGGQVLATKAIFARDRYFGEISVEAAGDHTALLFAAAEALASRMPGHTEPPIELAWFAPEGLQPGFPRLIPQSVLGLRMLKRGYVAQYATGKAFFVAETNAEAASALFAQLKQRFSATGEAKAGDEAFVAEDRYLGKLCIFRKGRRVGGFTNAQNDAVPMAARLAEAVP